jgi:ribosome-associated protein
MEQTSRTQKKNAALALQELGERLMKLSSENLKLIDLPADLYRAVLLAKALKKHGPRNRQMQYIGTLMRKCDPLPIQEALQRIEQGTHKRSPARGKNDNTSST